MNEVSQVKPPAECSVVIPVGPYVNNIAWLDDALDSLVKQTVQPKSVIFIYDGMDPIYRRSTDFYGIPFYHYRPPWRLGVGHAFNFGVALSKSECVFMMGSDDVLAPECLEYCLERYAQNEYRDAYYHVPVSYMSDGHVQYDPCNAAMVTKGLWRKTGGFPIEAPTAPDAALISILMVHIPEALVSVGDGRPLYYYREHDETDTRKHGRYHAEDVIVRTRNILTEEWQPPVWSDRYGI